jgi:hypothetical protein
MGLWLSAGHWPNILPNIRQVGILVYRTVLCEHISAGDNDRLMAVIATHLATRGNSQ